jgi:hypothetical protein
MTTQLNSSDLGHPAGSAKVPGCDEEVAVEMPGRHSLVQSGDESAEDLGEVLRKRIGDLGRNPPSYLEAAAIPGGGTHALEATERRDSRAVRKFPSVFAPSDQPVPNYPRPCPRCVVMTVEADFGLDRSKASGRRSYCKACDRRRGRAYYDARKDELYAQRVAAREAAWQAGLEAQVEESRLGASHVEHRPRGARRI